MTSPRGQEVVAWRQHRRHSSLSGHTIIQTDRQTDRQYKRRSFIRHTDISHKAAEAPSSVITSSMHWKRSLVDHRQTHAEYGTKHVVMTTISASCSSRQVDHIRLSSFLPQVKQTAPSVNFSTVSLLLGPRQELS